MKLIGNAALFLVFSLLFLFIWPTGVVIRRLQDPLRLNRGERSSYLRMAASTGLAPHSAPCIDETRPGFARKS